MTKRIATSRPPCLILAGRAYGSALRIMRSLGRRGVPCHVGVIGDSSTLPYLASRYGAGAHPVRGDSQQSVAASLVAWVRGLAPDPASPLMVLSDDGCRAVQGARRELVSMCRPVVPRDDVLDAMLDKATAHRHAARAGLRAPRSITASSVSELEERIADLRPPLVVKPAAPGGVPGLKARIVRDAAECLRFARGLPDRSGALVVEEYIEGPDAAVTAYLFYRSRDGARIVEWTGRKLRQSPPRAGIMAYGTSEELPDVRRLGRRLVEALDYRGVGGVEFKHDERGPVFIEMSTRFEGFHGLAARAGVDVAWAAYADTALGQLEERSPEQVRAAYLNGQTYLRVIARPGGLRMAATDVPGFLRSPKRIFSVWAPTDPSPAPVAAAVEAHRALGRAWSAVLPRRRAGR